MESDSDEKTEVHTSDEFRNYEELTDSPNFIKFLCKISSSDRPTIIAKNKCLSDFFKEKLKSKEKKIQTKKI